MTEQHELAHTGATGTTRIAATVCDDRVVRGVETAADRPAPDRRLYDWIEPEAMVDLFAHAAAKDGDVRLEFAVGDCTVVVTSEGAVAVRNDPVRTGLTE